MKLLITSERNLPQREGLIRFLDHVVPSVANEFTTRLILPKSNISLKYQNVKNIFVQKGLIKISDYSFPKVFSSKYKSEVNEADLVLVNSIGVIGWRCIQECIRQKKPYIIYVHLLEWKLLNSYIKILQLLISIEMNYMRKYFNKSTKILVPSSEIKKELVKIGIKENLIFVVELGVDTKLFMKKKIKKENTKKITIGFSGRFAIEKNIQLLYKVFLGVRDKYKDKLDIELLLIGDGPERNKFREAKITGFVDNVEDYLNKLDIYVMPSIEETTCLAALEAMSCELPVVATKVGVIKNIIKDNKNGYFFKDEFELESKLIYLIEHKNERLRLGKNARKSVLKLSWKETCRKIEREIRASK